MFFGGAVTIQERLLLAYVGYLENMVRMFDKTINVYCTASTHVAFKRHLHVNFSKCLFQANRKCSSVKVCSEFKVLWFFYNIIFLGTLEYSMGGCQMLKMLL